MKSTEHSNTNAFHEYFRLLRKRWLSVFTMVILTVVAALAFSYMQEPIYRAVNRVLVQPIPGQAFVNVSTESEVVASEAVAQLVAAELGTSQPASVLLEDLKVDPIRTPSVNQSEVLLIAFYSSDPRLAQAGADAFANEYLSYRRSQAIETVERAQGSIEERMTDVRSQLSELIAKLEDARARDQRSLIQTLETERSVLTAQLGVLQQRLDDTSASVLGVEGGQVLEFASFPRSPVSPNFLLNSFLAVIAGLLLGIGLAFARERLDHRFKDREDVERALALPVLASIPRFSVKRSERQLLGSSVNKGKSSRGAGEEAFRSLRTNIQFTLEQQSFTSFLVTSPSAEEGKSAVAANLATMFALADKTVAVVSGDLRRPTLDRYFETTSDIGLTSFLLGEVEDASLLPLRTQIENLDLIASGPVPQNPAEMLTSFRLPQLFSYLEKSYDLVIVDSPPVLPVADALILASHVGGAILVLNASSTARSAALRAKEHIERSGCLLFGSVINKVEMEKSSGYYGYYYPSLAPAGVGSESKRLRGKSRRKAG